MAALAAATGLRPAALLATLTLWAAGAELAGPVVVDVHLDELNGSFDASNHSVGQGGLSPKPMWAGQADLVAALRPRVVRMFVQQYFVTADGAGGTRFDFAALNDSLKLIRSTGAAPLLSLVFKPPSLFPSINETVCAPNDWSAWRELVQVLVQGVVAVAGPGASWYEVLNEPDAGEAGGTPFRCNAEQYVTMFGHTEAAVRAVDPASKVGGPAVGNHSSPLIPALAEHCVATKTRLDFISYHHYDAEPARFHQQAVDVRRTLSRFPSLRPVLVVDEWGAFCDEHTYTLGMSRPCHLVESIWQMHTAGVHMTHYYQIRDHHVDPKVWAQFMSPTGLRNIDVGWNYGPVCFGLFNFAGHTRPSYYALQLVARMTGLVHPFAVSTNRTDVAVRALATTDPELQLDKLLLWNWAPTDAGQVRVRLHGPPSPATARCVRLDARPPAPDDNAYLAPFSVAMEAGEALVELGPYAVVYCQLV